MRICQRPSGLGRPDDCLDRRHHRLRLINMNLVLGISHERDRTNLRMLGHQFLVCHPLTKVDSKQH